MSKAPSPLLGYNNNVRHKNRVFHIQTEDSGVKYGHIITHLFMDGGRILKSVKTSYTEYVGNAKMADIVRDMMKQQHKAMFIALRDGKFDPIAIGDAEASQMTRALAAESPPSSIGGGAAAAGAAAAAATAPEPAAAPAPAPAPVPAPPPMPPASAARAARASVPAPKAPSRTPPPLSEADAPPTIRQPPAGDLQLDIDALERAAAANAASPVLRAASDLPPPPANLFREKASAGKYRMTPVPPGTAPAPEPAQPARAPGSPARPASQPAAASSSAASAPERRFAPTRPAAIFGQARPQQGKSIFGEDLISDKSLDEVILSYLAEDLDEKK